MATPRIISTVTELRSAWAVVSEACRRDLACRARLVKDPVGAFLANGFALAGEARSALYAALPTPLAAA